MDVMDGWMQVDGGGQMDTGMMNTWMMEEWIDRWKMDGGVDGQMESCRWKDRGGCMNVDGRTTSNTEVGRSGSST